MENIKLKTVNEWIQSVNGRGDWCYKTERKNRANQPTQSKLQLIHDDMHSRNAFDRHRAFFLMELDSLMD